MSLANVLIPSTLQASSYVLYGIWINLDGEPSLFVHEKNAPATPADEVMPDAATGESDEEMSLTAAIDNY